MDVNEELTFLRNLSVGSGALGGRVWRGVRVDVKVEVKFL